MQSKLDSTRALQGRGCGQTRPVILALLLCVAHREARADSLRIGETNGLLEIRSMVVDGVPVSPRAGGKLRLPSQPRIVFFGFGPVTTAAGSPLRIRFKLDGYDDQWRENAAEMRLGVRFFDASGDNIGETEFKTVGQSAGWTGNPETAPFVRRRETIVVPARARSFWAVMSSAGPPATVGVYAITNLTVRTLPSNNGPSTVALPWAFDPKAGGVSADGVPADWRRDGIHPSMARIIECGAPPHTKGLAIVDDDLNGHAEWHPAKGRAAVVTPGDRLVFEWDEAYSFGLGGPAEVPYSNLPPGDYRFRINALSLGGIPGEAEVSLAFEVPLAFWRTPRFWGLVGTLILAAVAGGWRYLVWRRMRLQLQQLEQQRAVDRERLRIAQDIHDDLGARITQISLLSAVAQREPSFPEDARADFGRVSQMTRDLVSALYETVWAVNPENDNLDALANYLCQMGNQLCAQARLRCRLDVPDSPPSLALSSQVRHHLILAVKEAIHNVIKHAHASEVRLRIAFESAVLNISIHDDGRGFDPAACPPGNGLGNLKCRLESIGGSFTIESRLGAGTDVRLRLPVAETA